MTSKFSQLLRRQHGLRYLNAFSFCKTSFFFLSLVFASIWARLFDDIPFSKGREMLSLVPHTNQPKNNKKKMQSRQRKMLRRVTNERKKSIVPI